MHANPSATETLTGEQCEPVNGHGGPASVTVLRKPGEMIGALKQGTAAGGAAAGVPDGAPAGRPGTEAQAYLAGYYLG